MERNTYLVRRGDTLKGLEAYFGDSLGDVTTANPQVKPKKLLTPGTFISLPPAPPEQTKSLHAFMAELTGNPGEPDWLQTARRELGVQESKSKVSNPRIVEYLHTVDDLSNTDRESDQTAWCACFMEWVLLQVGIAGTKSARARSYEDWGDELPLTSPRIGALAVFKRPGGGHVGFYTGPAGAGKIMVLGGNEGNAVSEKPYPVDDGKYKLLTYRWPGGR